MAHARKAGGSWNRGAFAQICLVHQFCPFLDQEPFLIDLSHLLFGLLQYILHGAALEDYAEVITGPECSDTHNFHCPSVQTSLLHELHCLPVGFWVQSKVLVTIFKGLGLYDPGLGYLLEHFSLRGSACSTTLDREDAFQVPWLKCGYLMGPQRGNFLVTAPLF